MGLPGLARTFPSASALPALGVSFPVQGLGSSPSSASNGLGGVQPFHCLGFPAFMQGSLGPTPSLLGQEPQSLASTHTDGPQDPSRGGRVLRSLLSWWGPWKQPGDRGSQAVPRTKLCAQEEGGSESGRDEPRVEPGANGLSSSHRRAAV